MTDIIDKFDKSLKETKSKIEKNQELWSKVVKEQRKILDNYFNINILSDFEKLEKVYKKHLNESHSKNSIKFIKDSKKIKIFSETGFDLGWTTELIIEVDSITPPLPLDLHTFNIIEKYKPSIDNIYFEVSRLDENEKGDIVKFKYSEKEKAYDYLNKNFKKHILHILTEEND
jgi:hypothetical protein